MILESITGWRSVSSSEIGKDDGSLYDVNQNLDVIQCQFHIYRTQIPEELKIFAPAQ